MGEQRAVDQRCRDGARWVRGDAARLEAGRVQHLVRPGRTDVRRADRGADRLLVRAPVVAADRGIEVVEEKRRATRDYTSLVAVAVDGVRVAGTTRNERHILTSALGFELEMELAPRMAFLLYDDVPGVIGRVGTLFGEAGVNIANMTVSRNRQGGKALMALSIDSPATTALQAQLREGMDEAYLIG
jgi:hypothetical protein